jgi:hypothetical protein
MNVSLLRALSPTWFSKAAGSRLQERLLPEPEAFVVFLPES